MLMVEKTKLDGVLLVKPDVFSDFRGTFTETYNEELYIQNGLTARFVQDDMSQSKKHVLRGIHVEDAITKLVWCGYGELFCVIVNCDESSSDFGKWEGFILTDKNRWQLYVPPKHGIGHVILSDGGMFSYKQTGYYDPSGQRSYKYDEPRFNISWPVKDVILSERDKAGKYIEGVVYKK